MTTNAGASDQLEAQLADRSVTIELSDDARLWLVDNGYDEAMGARPMARLIQSTIKTPLADEVLFGRLKDGGAVRVVVNTGEFGVTTLGLEFPEGPVAPKPEKVVADAAKRTRKGKSGASFSSKGKKNSSPHKKAPELETVGNTGNDTPPPVSLLKE
jgi:ATP-dependent Clp protease ATP-binding subunit ClpA